MAGIPGNAATLAIGKQSAKGTPQATPTYKLKFVGGDVGPIRDMVTLAETDATVQDGANVVVGTRVEGSTEHYLRPDDFGLIAYATMGATSASGGTDKTHTATLATSQPYLTLFKAINSTSLVDRYVDCRVSQLVVRGQAGGVLTYGVTWGGLSALLGQTDPVLTPVSQSPLVYPQVTCTIGGSAPGTVQNFEVTVNRNASFVPGDIGLSQVDYVSGKVSITGSLSLLFENDQTYRAFHTGATAGTTPGTTVFAQALNINAQVTTVLGVQFDFANVEYTEYAPPINVDGSPIVVQATFRSKPASVVADYLEIITKNTVASY